ncbi:FecR family protein [Larkinella bovis]|uniref:FecR family protein n=1 Tax=Larkinella bovis TaxID=683041 RepID=UPI0036D2194A
MFDFFEGRATAFQRKSLEAWLADDANQETYYQYLDEWESGRPQFAVNVDQALETYQRVLTDKKTPERPARTAPVILPGFSVHWLRWSVAASVLLVSVAMAYVLRSQLLYTTYRTAFGQTKAYHLSDGTEVTLNANSVLRVPRFGFGSDTREVFLEGEGEFKVTHTVTDQRFIVRTADRFQVEVLGTEFVVYARKRGKRVFLSKGKVKLDLPQGQQLYMRPGNVVTIANSGQYRLTHTAQARPYVAWKDHWFYFDNTSLAEVATQIQEQFGVKVVVPDTKLAQRRIAGNYRAEQADDLLQILSELLTLNVMKKSQHIELQLPKSLNP